ncbi:insulin receptor substrate 2-like isoform X3 [Megalops cyprinoides]|uniref:insulin receptor substrate 2-like isoform X3 n=1 Tax=Megalops cyprinoides TaxID=118141 RepID=UPI0018643031|nr:insulin receptor substrate 2-like isoform X3 [Megalops cyprinoides]
MESPPTTGGPMFSNVNINNNNIKKCGYLRKQKHGHKRFFVLKEQSEGFPARLEYYESEKKWKNKSAAKRVIPLDSCLNINKRADAKYKHLIALYTKDEYFAVAADNEQEQENWYTVLTDLMNEGKVYDGSASNSASSLVGFEEANYGIITPSNAAYKEVWQVNLKSKGLGQSKNLTGVYRLCLSCRTISFVKLNSEVASVSVQLMNIRRCGHSDSFFFIEVGRSASIGPGELWMQADDSVVAQNIHETILEAMKAMKELSEFRPRSKSQSSGTNPISVPARRHLNNLPPSQTGLLRRSRTDSTAATSPVTKFTSCRIRTASEGDGTMTRPMSLNGSPISPSANRIHLSRSNTVTARPCKVFGSSSLQHSKSISMPVSHSPPPAVSPVSLSSSSGMGSASETIQRASSGIASVSGSPSEAGFISCDDYGSSPGEVRHHMANRSNMPESMADTPPSHEGVSAYGYMSMERPGGSLFNHSYQKTSREEGLDLDKTYRKRTYSLTTPPQQRAPQQVSSTSLDEYTLMWATHINGHSGQSSHTASPKVTYPEDYGDVEIGSLKGSGSNLGNDGYMPMMPWMAPQGGKKENYVPMSPMCVSAPKQIINPHSHPQTAGGRSRTNSPGSCSLDDSGYMHMWCGSNLSVESADGKLTSHEYMNMSPVDSCFALTPSNYLLSSLPGEPLRPPPYSYSSLPRAYKMQAPQNGDSDQYVLMNLQNQKITEESGYCMVSAASAVGAGHSPSPMRQGRTEMLLHRGRTSRPSRLILDTLMTLPGMNEHPLPTENSPGEYIKIDFSDTLRCSRPSMSMESPAYSLGSSGQRRSPLSDYMNIDLNTQLPKPGDDAPVSPPGSMLKLSPCPFQPGERGYPKAHVGSAHLPGGTKDNHTEMVLGITITPLPSASQPVENAQTDSPTNGVEGLTLTNEGAPGLEVFLVPCTPVDPDRGAKVIRADLQGRRRHSSETFSSTTMVTPVFPSFAHDPKRHSSASVENVSIRNNKGSDEYGSPMCRKTSAGFQNGLNYLALNLMDGNLENCEGLARLKAASYCKGGINGIHVTPYVSLGFKETAATVKALSSLQLYNKMSSRQTLYCYWAQHNAASAVKRCALSDKELWSRYRTLVLWPDTGPAKDKRPPMWRTLTWILDGSSSQKDSERMMS